MCEPGKYSPNTPATAYSGAGVGQHWGFHTPITMTIEGRIGSSDIAIPLVEANPTCLPCPAGKYQDAHEWVWGVATSCHNCTAGRHSFTEGATACIIDADQIASIILDPMTESPDDASAQTQGCDALRNATTDAHGITCGGNWPMNTSNCDAIREAGGLVPIAGALARFPDDDAVQTACDAALAALTGDPCDGVDCGEGGACVLGECECEGAYSGDRCEEHDLCFAQDCGAESGQGFCQAADGSCRCMPGFSGEHCECAGVSIICPSGLYCAETTEPECPPEPEPEPLTDCEE